MAREEQHHPLEEVEVAVKYKLTFYGKRKGSVHGAFPSLTELEVESSSEDAAAMRAYETHEHITGGVMGVKVEKLESKEKRRA